MMTILEDVIIEQKLGLYDRRPDRHRMDGLCILFLPRGVLRSATGRVSD